MIQGGAELILDREFATEVNAELFGSFEGKFAEDKPGVVYESKVESIQLDDFRIKNIPVNVMDLRSNVKLPGLIFGGILGTVVLSHFLSSIDYKNGKLVLRKKTDANFQYFGWLEHIILLRGSLLTTRSKF